MTYILFVFLVNECHKFKKIATCIFRKIYIVIHSYLYNYKEPNNNLYSQKNKNKLDK